jgi:CRISPR/Cas system-associated protein Cas10 (large subunit of type III CRISPR-Cas system)
MYVDTINSDIKAHGVEAKKFNKPAGATGGFRPFKKKQVSVNAVQTSVPTVDYTDGKHEPKGRGREEEKGAYPKKNKGKKGVWKKPYENRDKGMEGCSLCGKRDHRAADGCPNMISDRGNIVPVIPSQNTCTACPPFVKPRLHHNVAICPFRKGGVFNNKA